MTQQIFVDRKNELSLLKNEFEKKAPSFFVLYGRRRVGKTELLLKFLEGKTGIYFLSTTEGDKSNINAFQEKASEIFGEYIKNIEINDWYNLFKVLIENAKFKEITKQEKFVIIFDEFSYLILGNKNIPSIFQKIWDEILSKENVMLILCGSVLSIMENKVLGYKSPLYGRRTAQLELQPLEFKYLCEFFPNYSIEDLSKVWFILGGIPAYLLKFDKNLPLWENVERNILHKESYLYKEADFLLVQEFREPKNYKIILKAISMGNHTLGEICNFTGLDKSMVSKYLDVLSNLKLIREIIPVTASQKYKRRLYVITDPYFNFWFRFVYPNLIDLEAERYETVLSKIKSEFNQYSGYMFEYLVEELIRKRYFFRNFSFTKIGKEWGKIPKTRDVYEIDVVALNEQTKEILFVECKWKDNVNPEEIMINLIEKSKYVKWSIEKRKEHYAIFAKSFSRKINEYKGYKVYCIDLKDLEKLCLGNS